MKLQKVFENFENYLIENAPKIPSFHPYYKQALWEMVLNGGKRFRPKLLLSIVYANAPKLLKKSFVPALALEVLHTYSLIHDDLPSMDNANLRRGAKTLHIKYDEAGAILIGDALNTHSFYLLSTSKFKPKIKTKLIKSLSYNGGVFGMVLGQALDCHFENHTLPIEKLQIIHLNKTAKLIAASLQMGGIICGFNKQDLTLLYELGLKLGLFFQIRDDIIDATQSSIEAGKDTQNDKLKNSYVNLLGLKGARVELQNHQEQIKNQLNFFNKETKDILETLLQKYFI